MSNNTPWEDRAPVMSVASVLHEYDETHTWDQCLDIAREILAVVGPMLAPQPDEEAQ